MGAAAALPVQALCLRGCLVKQLPEAVTALCNLETLSLRNNYHDKMDWGTRNWKYGGELIPTSLAQLGMLQHLDISGIQVPAQKLQVFLLCFMAPAVHAWLKLVAAVLRSLCSPCCWRRTSGSSTHALRPA